MKKLLFFLLPLYLLYCFDLHPSTAIIGTGYVGSTTGACLAYLGNKTICCDVDEQKINAWNQGIVPIYEPGLAELVSQAVAHNNLSFTTDIEQAIKESEVVFIAVGTPMNEDGSANLSYIESAIKMIAANINGYKVICTKSTVPIGTGNWIKQTLLDAGVKAELFDVVSNPEFLREGSAVKDFLQPDRIVIGVESERAEMMMRQVYAKLIAQGVPLVVTNLITSESIKYAANAFLATKLSFINEIANLCDASGADITTLTYAIGLDKRISPHFLKPGPGFGGSCFPKDCEALIHTGKTYHVPMMMIETALKVNAEQKKKPFEKLRLLLNDELEGKTIAILGLAFKDNTDDIRYSPSITLIEQLLERGACIRAYDPAANANMARLFPQIIYCSSSYEALSRADALVIMTEWPEFKELDLVQVKSLLKEPILVDTRNMLNPDVLKRHNFRFSLMGQGK